MLLVVGIIIGIILLIALLAGFIIFYFALRKKWPYRKIGNEVIVISTVFLMAFAIRLAVVLCDPALSVSLDNIETGVSAVFFVLYSTIGGLSFEGIDGLTSLSAVGIMQSVYYGVLVVAGLIVLLIISVKISYEWYSYLALRGRRLVMRKYRRIFVFTDVTEESLLLAADIKRTNGNFRAQNDGSDVTEESLLLTADIKRTNGNFRAQNDGSDKPVRKKRDYLIVFTSDRLDPFDRKNEMHREIMCNGYYYYSYKNNRPREGSSILKILGLKSSFDEDAVYKKEVHIFALKNDKELRAAEEDNSDLLFKDIEATLNDFTINCVEETTEKGEDATLNDFTINCVEETTEKGEEDRQKTRKKADKKNSYVDLPCVLKYYVLSNRSVNYQFFIRMLNKCVPEESCRRFFQINILNEAVLSARDMIERLKSYYIKEKNVAEWENYLKAFSLNEKNAYRTCILGFGDKGEQAMKQLYMHECVNMLDFSKRTGKICGEEENDGKNFKKFIADVYDTRMDELSGKFSYAHPLYACLNESGIEDENIIYKNAKESYVSSYPADKKANAGTYFDNMHLPIVVFRNKSCFGLGFMKNIDEDFAGAHVVQARNYRSFVVTLGDDNKNISMANLLLDDFKHELSELRKKPSGDNLASAGNIKGPCGVPKILFVSIRNEKNISRINWSSNDEEDYKNDLIVIPFGCRTNVWSCKMISDDKAAKYNWAYNKACGMVSNIEKGESISYKQLYDQLGKVNNIVPKEYLSLWYGKVDCFKQESNRMVSDFVFNNYFAIQKNKEAKDWSLENDTDLSQLEHIRWNRFHINNGWTFFPYVQEEKARKEEIKEHRYLCPFDELGDGTKAYDKVNIYISQEQSIVF